MYEFTKRAEEALNNTRKFVIDNNYIYVGTEHILYGLVKEKKSIAARILSSQNITDEYIVSQIFKIDGRKNKKKITKEPELTPRAKRVLENSIKEAKRLGYNYVGTEHILLSLMKETDSIAVRMLIDIGANPEKMFTDILKVISEDSPVSNIYSANEVLTPNLDMYSIDLTYEARKGKIDKIIGREKELNRIIQILTRKTKNNPLIIGKSGVGKTAIVEGLAYRIAHGNIPDELKEKRIIMLDISSMIAGAKYRGDFEDRFKKCIEETKKAGNVIIFIDEFRTIIGAGSAEGAMDAANILKPHLLRESFKIIGATTEEEYLKYIEKDSSLNRRFQVVKLSEPTEEETLKILKEIKTKYEKYHNVKISDKALKEAVLLSNRYITNKCLPDKAIDVIDEACSKAKQSEKKENCSEDKVEEIKRKIKAIKENKEKTKVKITEKIIDEVISSMTSIPVEKINESEENKLKNLETNIKDKIIGQDEAVSALAKSIKRSRVGFRDPKRPIASFLLTGPTGVGKTELVKVVAKEIFNDEDSLVRFDMSEYMESHSVSKLIGSPPGYVGYEEGGLLTSRIKKKPYSIILLDEIEKAHQDVYNILLQILDDGRLTDSFGETVDFKNTIIIMTSNVGARNITEIKNIGFVKENSKKEEYEKMKEKVIYEVNKKFSPEFLNRLDDIIVFNKLDEDSIKKITKLLLKDVEKRVGVQGIKISFEDSVVDYISKVGYDEKRGARPLKRAIQKNIEDKFADYVINKKIDTKDSILVSFSKSKNEIEIIKRKKEPRTKQKIKATQD